MIIIYDSKCNLCNASVKFIIKRDNKAKFKFASFQSDIGAELLKKNNYLIKNFDTIVLLKNKRIYTKSSAALLISKELQYLWMLFYILIIIPKFIRDTMYLFVSKNRYKWFGKRGSCLIPTPEIRSRFLN